MTLPDRTSILEYKISNNNTILDMEAYPIFYYQVKIEIEQIKSNINAED